MRGHRKRAGYRTEEGGWGWMVLLVLALVLFLGKTEPGLALKEDAMAFLGRFDGGEVLETLGRTFTQKAGEAAQVFGQQVLGLGN